MAFSGREWQKREKWTLLGCLERKTGRFSAFSVQNGFCGRMMQLFDSEQVETQNRRIRGASKRHFGPQIHADGHEWMWVATGGEIGCYLELGLSASARGTGKAGRARRDRARITPDGDVGGSKQAFNPTFGGFVFWLGPSSGKDGASRQRFCGRAGGPIC